MKMNNRPHEETWIPLTQVYNQDEAGLICGLLTTAGIPNKMERDAIGDLYGLTIGPLARIVIWVPAEHRSDAERIINESGAAPDSEEDQ
ncbi:hypothetical protein EDC14_101215 [Hydrogenispora ethanolica]|jgi:hypothetical protein|uniref:Signal transducing protein n=1 Tax=Hydrogenispora ethanolica TaxID=1082276 RepID=A0A4R1RS67_HYDET|nr:hypothetical protein [Hydrogenispora ethanolica]TCL69318.1 hypothetical protein EDC14_101215 [Hydrogenispora ethanolica]